MDTPRALRTPFSLNALTAVFLFAWIIVAAFPLFWIQAMSFKLPVDAFGDDPAQVIMGPATLAARGGISLLSLALGLALLVGIYNGAAAAVGPLARRLRWGDVAAPGWIAACALVTLSGLAIVIWIIPAVARAANALVAGLPFINALASPLIGVTSEHYVAVWSGHSFYKNFLNSMFVTTGVVVISLTVGTLAGYALARTKSSLAFWLLITALVFRALPHSVLVSGYMPPFINSREILMPLWNAPVIGAFLHIFSEAPPTLYGQPLAVIMVLVAINQPFTIWMLRSFFESIPVELDEAARVDGCTQFEAFRRVIMPVMWPGVITTGLFSFLLAYNDYLVCALLLDGQSQTMVPAITQYFNRETTTTDQIEAVAAAVSITAPLFLLVMVFQRQIVSGLTAGAVKG
jgi:trehalose/maltose transport system permease protein